MARGSRRSISGYVRSSATHVDVARIGPARPFNIPFVSRVSLVPVEDLRRFHPLGVNRFVKVVSGDAVQPLRVARPSSRGWRGLPAGLAFAVPGKTIVCVRRRRRREVLFAKKARIGKGARRRNWRSDIWCSR